MIKRVTEFYDFSACWPTDQLKARGLVASIRDLVNVKDSFTRMSQERDNDRRERLRQPRLSPRLSEWLMGLPPGWVTDLALPYTAQHRAIGNGVVPQQATAALRVLVDLVL